MEKETTEHQPKISNSKWTLNQTWDAFARFLMIAVAVFLAAELFNYLSQVRIGFL
jgi:hypothetical protein